MLLLLLLGAGVVGPVVPPVRAYAAISYSLVDNGAISLSLIDSAEITVV